MDGNKSFDGDKTVLPTEFQDYLKGMDMEDIQPIQSTSPIHRTKSAQTVLKPIYRSTSADNLNMSSKEDTSFSPQMSHNTSLDEFKAKAKRKGIVPLPSPSLNLEEELKTRQHKILRLQKENEELREKIEQSYDGSCKDDFLSQIETISKLKLDCVLKQNEVDRLKAVEVTLKQTKQVLKDTTWALTVKEEELKNIKADMRDNYESRLNELITRLNDRELKLTAMKNERDAFSEKSRDLTLRVDELTQQINCYEQELEAKNKQFELKEAEIRSLKIEKNHLSIDSSGKIESLMEKLREMEAKINENASLVSANNQQLDESVTGDIAKEHDSVEILLPTTDQNLNQSLNDKSDTGHPDADTMSLEQITLMIQDNANLRLVVEESKEKLQLFMQESEDEKKELQKEVAEKGDQITELIQLVNTMRTQMPLSDNMEIYSTGIDPEQDDADEVRSCGSDDEGKQQMSHVISNYEKRINELQSLYDHDVFSLENDNETLRKEIKELQSNYLNVSHSNNSFALDFEDLKTTYDEKIDNLKTHYEDLLRKECVTAQKQQTELLAENNKLQLIVEEAEKKFMQHLQHMEANINSNYQTDLTSELQKIFAKQTSSISAIKEDLQRELNDIKSTHCEDLCTVEQEFGIHEMNKSGLDDTYSNEILKLTEERNMSQKTAQMLKDELVVMQQEYESLKDLYDLLSFDIGQYKNEKLQLLSQISVLSEESSNLKSSLRTRRNEVEEYKTKINDASKTIEDYTKKLIGKSDRSSNASDSLRSELEDLVSDMSSPRLGNKTFEMQKKSNLLSAHVKLLRSNLDEAKSELKNLYEEHGLSTAVYDRLSNILNLLKECIEDDILDNETDVSENRDEDCPPKLVLEDGSKEKLNVQDNMNNENVCDDINQVNTFEISENLSLDDDDLSDTTAVSDSAFTQQDFEKELRDLKIDIPLDYCSSTLKDNLNKENKDDSSSEKFEVELHSLRKENALLQQKLYSLSSDHIGNKIGLSTEFFHKKVTSFSEGNLDSLKLLLDNVTIFEGNDANGFKVCGKNDFTDNILNNLRSTLDVMQQENDAFKGDLFRKKSTDIGHDFSTDIMSTDSIVGKTRKLVPGSNWEASKDDFFIPGYSSGNMSIEPKSDNPDQGTSHRLPAKTGFKGSKGESNKSLVFNLEDDSYEEIETPISAKQSIEMIEKLQMDNMSLKQKILEFEKDIFTRNLSSNIALIGHDSSSVIEQPPSIQTSCSVEHGEKISLGNVELFNMHEDNASLKIKFNHHEHEIVVPGLSSVILFNKLSTLAMLDGGYGNSDHSYQAIISDNINPERSGSGTSHEIIDDEFDWDNSLAEPKMGTPKQMDSEGHTLKQRDSLSKSFSDLEIENENLRRENVSLKEEAERECTAIIGPGFASEILYYEHAQPVDGDSVGIKVNAIKTLLNNVVISQGNQAVSFNEYEGRDVILRLLLDIQVEVVDLIKENNVLKEETVKQKPYGISTCSVQTGDSIAEEVIIRESCDSVIEEDKDLTLDNFLILDGSDTSSLEEQDLLECEDKVKEKDQPSLIDGQESDVCTVLEEQTLCDHTKDSNVCVGEIQPDVVEEKLTPEFTSTVKDIHDCEIVNLGGENAHIMLKIKKKEKKVLLPAFSSVYFSSDHAQIPLSKSDLEAGDAKEILIPGFSSEVFSGLDLNKQLQCASKALVSEVIIKAVTKIESGSHDSLDRSLNVADLQNSGRFEPDDSVLNSLQTPGSNITLGSPSDKQRSNVSIVPGFSCDVLLQEQSITSAVDTVGSIDSLGILIENLLIFEGNEEVGYKTSDGNDLTKRFLNDCQSQLAKLRNENTALKLQSQDNIDNQSNTMDISLQKGLLGEILDYTQHAVTACTKEDKDSQQTGGGSTEGTVQSDDLRKENDDLQEKFQKQQSFIIPGFSSEILKKESISSLYSSSNTHIDDLPLLLENVAVFEGNDTLGYTKSEENDIAKILLNDFKTKIVDLLRENDTLTGKVEKMQAICESRVNEVINIEGVQPTFSGLVLQDDSETNVEVEDSVFMLPGFSDELQPLEDVLPFPEVDNLTRKLDALKRLLETLVIFKGNEIAGYVKYKDVNLGLKLFNDLEVELNEMKKENLRIKEHMQFSQDKGKRTTLQTFSTETDYQGNPILCDSLDPMPCGEEGMFPPMDVKRSGDGIAVPQFGGDGFAQKANFVPGFSSEMLHSEEAGPSFHREIIDPDVYHSLQIEVENLRKENALLKKQIPVIGSSTEMVNNESPQTIIDPATYQNLQAEVANLQEENALLLNKQGSLDKEISAQEMREKSQYANGTKNELIDLLLKKDKILDNLIGERTKGNIRNEHDDSVGAEYEESIRMSRAWMEAVNLQSLSQLREDLDEDYLERIKVVEEKLRDAYRSRIRKIAETCDQKVTQMKKDYEEEIIKLRESPDFLEETEASLGSYRESFDETCLRDDTRDDVDGDMEMTEDEIDTCVEMDGVTKHGKKQQKHLLDKGVNTMSTSFATSTESVEQNEIIKLKESLTELFRKPEVESDDVLFRLDDVEGILQENYARITDMTDKLKGKLYSVEKEMRKKFEEEKSELIVKTKNNILHDIARAFTDLINEHMMFVDDKVDNILTEHGKDVNALLQAIESAVQQGDAAVCGQEKGDIPEKLVHKIEQFFQTEKNILGVLESDKDTTASNMDGGETSDDDKDITMEQSGCLDDDTAIGISVWKRFFKDDDALPKEIQTELLKKKVVFKSSIEKDLNILINCVNTAFSNIFGLFAKYNDLKTKHKLSKIEAEMISSLAGAHTDMVLKNSIESVSSRGVGKEPKIDLLSKMGELLLKQLDPEKVSEHTSQYEKLLEQYDNEIPVEDDIEKFEKEADDVTRLCLYNAIHALLEKEGTPESALFSFEQIDAGKKVRFMNKFDDDVNVDEITKLNNNHKKELEELREQVAKNVKETTDDKTSEFENAKMDLVKQHQFILDEFIAEQEKEIEDIREEHKKELEKLKSGYVEQIYELQNSHKSDGGIERTGVNKDDGDEEDVKAQFQEQLEALKKQHSDDLSKQSDVIRLQFEEEHIENLNNLQKQIEDDHAEHLRLLSDCQQKQIVEIQDLKNQHDTFVQELQVDHSQEIEKLKNEISRLEEQCMKISGGILEDKEALERLRCLTQDDDDGASTSLSADLQDSISTSIVNCHKDTKKYLKEQCNSQVDTLLKVFDSVLRNVSSEVLLNVESSSETLLPEVSAKQSVEDLLNAVSVKPTPHHEIDNAFKQLLTEYERWHAEFNGEMENLTEEINQLKEENTTLLQQSPTGLTDKVNAAEGDKVEGETEAKLQRLQRQEEESSNFINILHSDIKKITDERDNFKEEIALLKQNSKEIVETIIKSEELLHEKLDEIIDNQLSGCNLSQYGLDTTIHSIPGKDVADSLIEMPLNLAAETEEPDFEPEFLKGVSSRFSETVDHFLQVLSLVFSDFKNTSMQQAESMDTMETTIDEDKEQVEENVLVVEKQQSLLAELEDKVNKNLDITKEIDAIKESINVKDILISNLEKTCSNQTDVINTNKANMKDKQTEIEALKYAIDNQQADIDKLKEQLIKKQMLMDAKECELIEMEQQLKKENQKHLTELEGAFDDQNIVEHSLEEKSKEVKDLKDFIESKQVLISELEEQLNNHQLLVESKEKQCSDLKEELGKQKEKYELEYKQLATDKSKEISAIFNELEETLKDKDKLENLIKSQEASAMKLTEEFDKLNRLSNTKEGKMAENEEQLKKEIAKLATDLENMTSNKDNEIRNMQSALGESTVQRNLLQAEVSKHQAEIQKLEDKHQSDREKLEDEITKFKALIDERQAQLEEVEEKLIKEKESYTSELKNMTSKNLKDHESIQNALDESMREKSILANDAGKYAEEMDKYQSLFDEKEAQLTELQGQLSKQKEKHALDLKELSDDKGKEITAIFNELEEKLKEKDALEDLVKCQETSILKLQEQLNKHNVMDNTKDIRMNEREELLKKEIAKLQLDLGNISSSLEKTAAAKNALEEVVNKHQSDIVKREQYLKECHSLIDEKQAHCVELEEQLSREKEKHVLDLDNLTASKNEELSNTQIALEEISRQKDEVEDLVNLKQAYISKLEEQLKELKVLLDEKVALLAGVEEHLAREKEQHALDLKNLSAKKTEELIEEKSGFEDIIQKQLDDIGKLDKQKKECEFQIEEKQTLLSEIEEKLMEERKKYSEDIENLSKEKTKEIACLQEQLVDMEKSLEEQLGEMKEQLIEEKEKHRSDMERLTFHKNEESAVTQNIIEEKDQLAEMINQQHYDISKLEEQLYESKTLADEKQKELSNVQEQLIEELNKSATSLQDLSMDKTEEINVLQSDLNEQKEKAGMLQNSIDQATKEKIQMQDVLNKQQAYIGELEEQMKKSKTFLDEKQMQLDGIEEQLNEAKKLRATDVDKVSKDYDEKIIENKKLNDVVAGQHAIVCELQEEVNKQNKLLEEKDIQLSDLEKEKENCASQIETITCENEEAMASLQSTFDEQSKEKDELEISIENQRALMSQMEEQLNRHKALIDSKENQFAQQAEKLTKKEREKEEEVSNLLNESAELKDLMASLQESLEAKVSDEAALSDMLEKEKAFSTDLEKQVNEKSEELVALKQQMEKETSQHLADLEQISIVKDEMIETIQKTLEDQSKEKAEFEKVIDNQLAVIAGLEEQLSAHKKLNEEKIVLLEERGQLLRTKDKSISDLEKEVKVQENKINAIQESHQKEFEEQESKTNVIEESLQQKLIQHGELNEHIISQQTQISELEKKFEEQQQLLSNTSHELNISREESEKISVDKQEEIVNIQKELKAQSKVNDDLKKAIEEQHLQMNKTEGELNKNKELIEAKCKELTKMEQQIEELTNDLRNSKERLDTIEKTLDEKMKQEADLNDLIEKQRNLIAELEKQVRELQASLNARNEELAAFKQQMCDERNKSEEKLQNALLNHKEDTENLQKELEQNSKEKDKLKSSIEDQQTFVCELEGQLHEYKTLLETKTRQLGESEQCKAEKEKHISELKKEHNELKGKVGNLEKTLKEKAQKEIDLNESIQKQKGSVTELEKKLQEHQSSLKEKNTELSNLKQQLSQERNQHMIDYEEAAAKQKETISNMEKVLEEEVKEKKELKSYVASQETLTEELKKQLSDHKVQITSKESLLAEMKVLHTKALEKRSAELEQAALEKSKCISNMEKCLDGEIKKKNELSNFVKHQEALIDDLERQLNDYKNTMTYKENDLVKIKEEHEKALKTQEDLTDKLKKQVGENKIKITQQENELVEVNGQLKAFEKLKSEFQAASKEKDHQISVLEKSISDQIKETDELKDIVKRQQALVCELEEQLNQERSNTSCREREMEELKEVILQRHKNQIIDLEKELMEEKEKLTMVQNSLKERTNEAGEVKEAVMTQKIKVTELEEQLNEQNVLLHAKDHELIEEKECLLKENAQQAQKWENEKQTLLDKLNQLEEKIRNLEYEINKKSEELSQLQKAHQEMQLSHINEIMKLNNEHRSQIGTLMEIPQKDRNIKVLLMDLQKEADEVLDLVLNVPDVNENTPAERIETLKATWLQEKEMLLSIIDDMRKNAKESSFTEMSGTSNPLSSADVEDFTQDDAGVSVASNISDIGHDGRDGEDGNAVGGSNRNRLQDQSETSTETPLVNGHRHLKDAFIHDNHIVSEFEKLLNDESKKVEVLTAKLEEEIRLKESIQMSHEVELAKVVERELNLKEKYLKVAELLQKEKNAKTRVMEMLNDAQRLNEIQSQNLEEVQNDKNSLLESYTIVSELENLLTKEKEKVDLINAKLEKEKYERSSLQIALEDEKEELISTKERECSLKEKCIELNKLLLRETEDRKNIADTLENEKKLISMEKKNLEQKESALNQRMIKLVDNNVDDKLKSLKAWEEEVKKREKSLASKEEKLKTLIKRIEQGYDILPQKQTKDSSPEKHEHADDGCNEGNDWLKQIEGNQLLDTRHLPLVADLNQKIKSLQKEKVKLADTLTDLKTEIIDYKQQLKDYQLLDKDNRKRLEDKEAKLTALSAAIHPTESIQDAAISIDGQKLLNAGWTIAKVQRLYLKYFRAESFRKALVYQKRYLTLMVNENETNGGGVNSWMKGYKRRPSFKVVVLAVISIRRMKYLVKKYHRNLHKSSPEYQYKDKSRSSSFKKKNAENVIDELEHSPPGTRGNIENGINENHALTNGTTRGNNRQPHSTFTPSKINSRQPNYSGSKQSHYVPPTTRLTLSEPACNRMNLSNHSNNVDSSNERLNTSEPPNERLHVNELTNGTHVNNIEAYLNRNHNAHPSSSMDNLYANDGVPRSYPRPSGIIPEEVPSRINGTNGDATLGNSRVDKTLYTNRPYSSPPSPLLSSTSRDVQEPQDDANESLSSYIHTLETLQNRLKKVGYNDRTRPSLM